MDTSPIQYPCLDHGKKLEEIQTSLNEISRGLFGNPKIGHIGMVQRVEDHSRRITSLEKTTSRWLAYFAGSAAMIAIAWEIAMRLTGWLK